MGRILSNQTRPSSTSQACHPCPSFSLSPPTLGAAVPRPRLGGPLLPPPPLGRWFLLPRSQTLCPTSLLAPVSARASLCSFVLPQLPHCRPPPSSSFLPSTGVSCTSSMSSRSSDSHLDIVPFLHLHLYLPQFDLRSCEREDIAAHDHSHVCHKEGRISLALPYPSTEINFRAWSSFHLKDSLTGCSRSSFSKNLMKFSPSRFLIIFASFFPLHTSGETYLSVSWQGPGLMQSDTQCLWWDAKLGAGSTDQGRQNFKVACRPEVAVRYGKVGGNSQTP